MSFSSMISDLPVRVAALWAGLGGVGLNARGLAQRRERPGGLALDVALAAAEDPGGLGDALIAVEAEHQHGPLPWRQGGDAWFEVDGGVRVGLRSRADGQVAGD